MSFRVVMTPAARRQEVEQAEWLDRRAGSNFADRWLDAVQDVLDKLRDMPRARPSCLDPAAKGLDLREAYVKVGAKVTHRLIFRIEADAVVVLLVHPTARGDFAAGDV